MKIIAILNSRIGAGGGFDQGLNAVLQMQRLCQGRHGFEVVTSHAQNIQPLKDFGIAAHTVALTRRDRALDRLSLNNAWQSVQLRLRLIGPFEKRLIQLGCDLAYFVAPDSTSACLQKLNHIATVWDVCHRDHPEFPEVRDFNEIFVRERYYQRQIHTAVLVLSGSEGLSDSMAHRFGIDRARLLAMPFAPSPLLDAPGTLSASQVAALHGLQEPYYFYPAQFWAHKNHVRILQALALLKQAEGAPLVAFCGKDYGNLAFLRQQAAALGVADRVKFLGFVPSEHMRGLYEGALGVVMPTYFGPTNLPPLEAWALDKPLIYSAHLAEPVGDAAWLVNADRAQDLVEALRACARPEVRERLVASGRQQLARAAEQRAAAEATLLQRLDEFAARRACWAPEGTA